VTSDEPTEVTDADAPSDPSDETTQEAAAGETPAADPASEPPASEEDELASEIASEIAELAAERDQYKDIAQRVQADFENYRKRVQQQIRDEADRATARLAEALLPVLDATEAAYLRHPDEVGPLLNVLLAELRKQGLETVDLEGKPFDPNVAEAVAHESGEGGEVIVAEVLRSGYTWKGRTLRPAMVRTRD
jgi:molecular chaperone GrpE